jgi:hypothetical protein
MLRMAKWNEKEEVDCKRGEFTCGLMSMIKNLGLEGVGF